MYLCILYLVLERQKPPPDAYHTIVGPPIINRTSSVSATLGGITRPSSSSSPSVIKTTTESPSFDDAADHLLEATPKDGAKDIPLGSKIVVLFDKDVRTINSTKLFEVSFLSLTNSYYLYIQVICESPEQGSTPVKGRVNYDTRQMKLEFIPQRTLFPNSKIIVQLHGIALTTANCTQSVNIKDAAFSFHTCNPPPKTVGIKLKNQSNVSDTIQRCVIAEGTLLFAFVITLVVVVFNMKILFLIPKQQLIPILIIHFLFDCRQSSYR